MIKKVNNIFLLFVILLLGNTVSPAQDDYSKINGWHFKNTSYYTDSNGNVTLPWDIYAESYIGIEKNKDCVLHPLDCAFYDVYNKAFGVTSGNCFGMSLLGLLILKEEGHYGFCKPVWQYSGDKNGPSSKQLKRAITIMQCHEWSYQGIKWLIENLKGNHLRNAKFAYDRIQYYLNKGDLPMITIVKDFSLAGHTLVPYRLEKSGSDRLIYVYDSNRWFPEDSTYYQKKENVIKITSGNAWSFKMAGGNTWQGTTSSGGFIFATPVSIVKPTSRNPLELGALASNLNTLVFSGAALSQMTDDSGRRFYKSAAPAHVQLDDIEDDPNLAMPNAVRLIGSFGPVQAGKTFPEIYIFTESLPGDLNLEITGIENQYQTNMMINGDLVTLTGSAETPGSDRLEIRNIGTDQQELMLTTNRTAANFSLDLYRKLPEKNVGRFFKVSDMKIKGGSPVQIRLSENRDALLVMSQAEPLQYNLELIQTVGTQVFRTETRNIQIEPQQWQRLEPADWQKLNDARIMMKKVEVKKQPKLRRK